MSMKQERGFSMLEVMVAMVVIMVGALGIAGMQLLAITSTENARYQNVATMLGASLATTMQGNFAYWRTPPATVTVATKTYTGGPAAFAGSCVGLASSCSSSNLAAFDLRQWSLAVGTALPNGGATITCTASSPAICSVVISWTEKNVALQNASGSETGTLKSGVSQAHTYQTLVSIL